VFRFFNLRAVEVVRRADSFSVRHSPYTLSSTQLLLPFVVNILHTHFKMLSTPSFIPLSFALLSLFKIGNAYTLVATYDSTNFFEEFSFFTGTDPTEGFVDYVSQSVANSADLVYYQNNQVYLGVDYTTNNPNGGRESVRLSSNEAFSKSASLPPLHSSAVPQHMKRQPLTQLNSPRTLHCRYSPHARRNLRHLARLLDVRTQLASRRRDRHNRRRERPKH
jgi:hypothetical protein